MFDKDLFFSLCEKYNVEFSTTDTEPMIKIGDHVHPITENDITKMLNPHQVYFEYSSNKTKPRTDTSIFYLQEDYTMAC